MADRIIRDPKATETIDLGRLEIEHGRTVAQRIIDDPKATKKDVDWATRHVKEADDMLAKLKPPADAPTVTIGFVPYTKAQYLLARADEMKKPATGKKLSAKEVEADLAYGQEWLRWGLRGHDNMGIAFETETVEYMDRKYQVPTDDMLEFYGHLGIVYALQDRILRWTLLGGKKKTRSLPTSGESRETSTAQPAAETRA